MMLHHIAVSKKPTEIFGSLFNNGSIRNNINNTALSMTDCMLQSKRHGRKCFPPPVGTVSVNSPGSSARLSYTAVHDFFRSLLISFFGDRYPSFFICLKTKHEEHRDCQSLLFVFFRSSYTVPYLKNPRPQDTKEGKF